MALPVTPPCERFRQEVFDLWPQLVDLGFYNRRKIAGTQVWSQHAWGNAQDLGGDPQLLDLVHGWIETHRTRLKVRVVLWRVANHTDHIHVDFHPRKTGEPPYPTEDDEMELIKGIQRALNEGGFRDPTGATLTVDGQWGPKTEHAFTSHMTASLGGSVTITSGHLELE